MAVWKVEKAKIRRKFRRVVIFKIFGEAEGNSIKSFAVLGPSGPALSLAGSILESNSFDDMEIIMTSLDIGGGELMDYI